MSKENLEQKEKFRLFYLSRPWLPFEVTLLEACEIARKKAEIHSDVKLFKINGEEVNFQETLDTVAAKQ